MSSKYDTHKYSIMVSFIEFLPLSAAHEELTHAIRGWGMFTVSKTAAIIIELSSNGVIIEIRHARELLFAGARMRKSNTRRKAEYRGMVTTNVAIPPLYFIMHRPIHEG